MIKKSFPFFVIIAAIAVLDLSCDKIEPPYREDTGINTGDTCVFPNDASPVYRKILVEDYTGHLCGNCPDAAIELYGVLKPLYGDTLITLGVHAGPVNFTGVCPADNSYPPGAPAGSFAIDYRTPSGNTWFTDFNISNNPKGMVSRLNAPSGSLAFSGWGAAVQSIIHTPAQMKLQIINTYDSTSGDLNTCIKTTFLTANSGTYNLSVVLTEDSITDWQTDYNIVLNPPPPQPPPPYGRNDSAYVHRHVMRGTINTVYGEEIKSGAVATGDTSVKSYKINLVSLPAVVNPLNPTLNIDRCHIIAFVFDATTKEILQAEEAKVR